MNERRAARLAAVVLAAGSGAGVVGWGPAFGQDAAGPGVAAVLACRTVEPAKAQLACFRRAADALADPSAQISRGVAATASPPPFGLRAPRPKLEREAQAKRTDLKLVSIGDRGDGRAILNFDDGSTWIETDADPILRAVRPGDVLRIEKGMLGDYLLDLPHRSAVRVVRRAGA